LLDQAIEAAREDDATGVIAELETRRTRYLAGQPCRVSPSASRSKP
jgi:hypothetical protein